MNALVYQLIHPSHYSVLPVNLNKPEVKLSCEHFNTRKSNSAAIIRSTRASEKCNHPRVLVQSMYNTEFVSSNLPVFRVRTLSMHFAYPTEGLQMSAWKTYPPFSIPSLFMEERQELLHAKSHHKSHRTIE